LVSLVGVGYYILCYFLFDIYFVFCGDWPGIACVGVQLGGEEHKRYTVQNELGFCHRKIQNDKSKRKGPVCDVYCNRLCVEKDQGYSNLATDANP
jgi:hypothetical protein